MDLDLIGVTAFQVSQALSADVAAVLAEGHAQLHAGDLPLSGGVAETTLVADVLYQVAVQLPECAKSTRVGLVDPEGRIHFLEPLRCEQALKIEIASHAKVFTK